MRVVLTLIISLHSLISLGQLAIVKKVTEKGKAHLTIGIRKEGKTDWYFSNCSFKGITKLPDTTKMRLIRDLLEFTSDTIMTNNNVYNLSGQYTKTRHTPESKEYNLQIDALIFINFIAFSSKAFVYSPYPILIDKKTGTEINRASEGLKTVVEIYKQWYNKLKSKGFDNYPYPLCYNRYEWFATVAIQGKISKYPVWDNLYDCKNL